jgi:hypothetical protein
MQNVGQMVNPTAALTAAHDIMTAKKS